MRLDDVAAATRALLADHGDEMADFTHFDDKGNAVMVDVGGKPSHRPRGRRQGPRADGGRDHWP